MKIIQQSMQRVKCCAQYGVNTLAPLSKTCFFSRETFDSNLQLFLIKEQRGILQQIMSDFEQLFFVNSHFCVFLSVFISRVFVRRWLRTNKHKAHSQTSWNAWKSIFNANLQKKLFSSFSKIIYRWRVEYLYRSNGRSNLTFSHSLYYILNVLSMNENQKLVFVIDIYNFWR